MGEWKEKKFSKLKAGFVASEFGVLSSVVVGGKEGRKRKGKEIILSFLSSLAVEQMLAELE